MLLKIRWHYQTHLSFEMTIVMLRVKGYWCFFFSKKEKKNFFILLELETKKKNEKTKKQFK